MEKTQEQKTGSMNVRAKERAQKALERADALAAEELIREAFYDLYHKRGRIYRMNFTRGIFFGLGTFLGGTVVVAVVILLLSWSMSMAPVGVRDFIQWIIDTLSK